MPRFWLNVEPQQIKGGILVGESFEISSHKALLLSFFFASLLLRSASPSNIWIVWNAFIVVVFGTGNFRVGLWLSPRRVTARVSPTFATLSYRWRLFDCALGLVSIWNSVFKQRARPLTFNVVLDAGSLSTETFWIAGGLFSSRRIFTFKRRFWRRLWQVSRFRIARHVCLWHTLVLLDMCLWVTFEGFYVEFFAIVFFFLPLYIWNMRLFVLLAILTFGLFFL